MCTQCDLNIHCVVSPCMLASTHTDKDNNIPANLVLSTPDSPSSCLPGPSPAPSPTFLPILCHVGAREWAASRICVCRWMVARMTLYQLHDFSIITTVPCTTVLSRIPAVEATVPYRWGGKKQKVWVKYGTGRTRISL